MHFQWSDNLAVGHEQIDAQHRELLGRFRDLLEACRQGRGKEKVVELFGFLDDYVVSHFAAEERLMAEHRHPGIVEHKSQHAWLVGRLTGLKGTLQEEGPSFSLLIEATQALLDWILDHIRSTDVRFAALLRERRAES